jgi:hypothetical protein
MHIIYSSSSTTVQPFDTVVPNVVVEWFTLLLHIRDIPGSNLGPETGYPD